MDNDLETLADSNAVSVHAGFPNPAIDRSAQGSGLALDLNHLLIPHPSSTYLFRISGHEWSREGIFDGDLAVIDRVSVPRPTDLVISWQVAGFKICRLQTLDTSETAWGMVSVIIHQYKNHA